MRTNITLSNPKPCEEGDNTKPTQHGNAFSSGITTATDFNKMSDAEIINFIKKKSVNKRTASREVKAQSDQWSAMTSQNLFLLKAGIIGCLLLLLGLQTFAQNNNATVKTDVTASKEITINRNIKGLVKSDEDKTVLPGVNVYLKGTKEGTYTDANGQFMFSLKFSEGDTLVFSSIGFVTQEYVITKETPAEIEIHMATGAIEMVDAVAVNEIYSPD